MSIADVSILAAAGWLAAGSALAWAGMMTYGIWHPRTQIFGPVVYRGDRASPAVALTFDDGPTPGSTDRVLDVLGELGVQATFFVIGQSAMRHPDLVRRIDTEGHLIGNHSFDHSHHSAWRRAKYWGGEIDRTDAAIAQIIGRRPAFVRPPMGLKTWHLIRQANARGQSVVTWSRRAWDSSETTVDRILDNLLPARNGDVLVMHDGIEPFGRQRDFSPTINAIRPLVKQLTDQGLRVAPLDQVLKLPPYLAPGTEFFPNLSASSASFQPASLAR